MSLKHRLDAIEAARARRQRRMMAATAAEYGLSVDEFLEEAEAFFTLPLVEQLAQVDDIDAELRRQGMSMNNVADIKATLIREYRPI
jgi:hypothetical protein